MEILQKFFPDTELNLETLRGLAQNLDHVESSGSQIALPALPPVAHDQVTDGGQAPELSPSREGPVYPNTFTAISGEPADIQKKSDNRFTELFTQQNGGLILDSLGTTSRSS